MSIAAPSTEYVEVSITEKNGQLIDSPTVKLALIPGTGHPADADWHPAEWVGPAAATRNARLLLGPGAVQMTPGFYYVWYQFEDTPEIPIRPAGGITIT